VYTDLQPDVLPVQGINHTLPAFSAALRVPPVALAAAFEPAQKVHQKDTEGQQFGSSSQ
jgi:hypothetical protein